MKFQFKIQGYQTEAVEAVVNVFCGQGSGGGARYRRELGDTPVQTALPGIPEGQEDAPGYRNEAVRLTDGQLLQNLRQVQARGNLRQSAALVRELGRCSLDVEMETGTGKTYVYIKTMFELNRQYGWSKFIVVVPSVAIREGVKKSFQMTQEHFMEHYGKKARFFIYNSANLSQLDTFSSGAGINVMIINTQAFAASLNENKNVEGRGGDAAARIIYSRRDDFGSRRPIDVLAANRPIIILDEPQKMGGAVTQRALKGFNPLFSINYSATHAVRHNLVYALDALDAFNNRLVKKIEVKGFEVRNLRGTDQYLYLESILLSSKRPPAARLELETAGQQAVRRERRVVRVGDSLYALSRQMEQYKGYTVSDIDPLQRTVFFANGERIQVGEAVGELSEGDLRRIQIRETILSHFEKEEQLFNLGVKTLSLFFIDEVARYRVYDGDGQEGLGEYGAIFEEEYQAVLEQYLTGEDSSYQRYLRAFCSDPHRAHRGYFSIDKKTGRSVDSALKRGAEFSDDSSAYDLIFKNKERLLSFEEPTRFLFSHSALREGWDNPNVFQICTLKHSDSQTGKRQEVGRGLRLCVDQSGGRMDEAACGDAVHEINKLTVVASESYREFVDSLQKDISAVLCDRPKTANAAYFEGKTVTAADGRAVALSERQAKIIERYLSKNDYIDLEDKVTDAYRAAASSDTLAPLPAEVADFSQGIHGLIRAVFDESALGKLVEDGRMAVIRENPLNGNFNTREFQALWDCINHKYAYRVDFSSQELIRKAAERIGQELFITQLQYVTTVGEQQDYIRAEDLERGDAFETTRTRTRRLEPSRLGRVKYDLVGKIAEGAMLTRRTAAAILKGLHPDKLALFPDNPEEFISKVIRLINEERAKLIVEHISYHRIEGEYGTEIFTEHRPAQSFEKAFQARRHIQDYVFTDGTAEKSVERRFAEDLDIADEVRAYAKLPRRFSIPTPLGRYSPDWAIAFREDSGMRHILFLAETKGSTGDGQLRPIESAKIECAKKLFNGGLAGAVRYGKVEKYADLPDMIEGIP